jgi:hypothetical protein
MNQPDMALRPRSFFIAFQNRILPGLLPHAVGRPGHGAGVIILRNSRAFICKCINDLAR